MLRSVYMTVLNLQFSPIIRISVGSDNHLLTAFQTTVSIVKVVQFIPPYSRNIYISISAFYTNYTPLHTVVP